ncbi:MAG: hypothetical protein ABW252_06690 [Polyangiales bacterium]
MALDENLVSVLFARLDAWRHLPAWQLERRADVFFSLYLREVVERECDVALLECVIPEIPLKVPGSNHADKGDYLLISADGTRAFLVELKTDVRSRRDGQDTYLARAAADGIEAVLEGIQSIVLSTSSHQKYFHLLRELERVELLKLPPDLAEYVFPEPRQGLTRKLREITLTTKRPRVEVVFVQPIVTGGGERCIDFECFARHVARHPDPLSQRFSESLLRWRAPAGAREAATEVVRGDRAQPRRC